VFLIALVAFVALAMVNILTTSPTTDEPTHLAAGWSYLKTGDYRLNPEHPPLLKKLAALPMLGMPVVMSFGKPWEDGLAGPMAQWTFAHELFYGLRETAAAKPTTEPLAPEEYLNDSDAMFTRGRMVLLLFGVLAVIVVFAWAGELWGWGGGALAAVLIAFDPSFLAHSGLVTTDVGVAALMVAALYFFWRALRRPSWYDVAAFALFFALAQAAKFSALLLVPIVVLIGVQRGFTGTPWKRIAAVLGIAASTTVVVLWAAYGFRWAASERPLRMRVVVDDWYATKQLLPQFPDGPPESEVQRLRPYARIGTAGRLLLFAYDRHLLPEAYVFGLASTLRSSIVRGSFLRGEFSNRGFPSYFFWAFLYKTTIPAIVMIIAAVLLARRTKSDALPFLLWPVVLYLAVSMQSSLNIGHRHILPIYPFLYVLCGALARYRAAWIGAAAAVLASLVVLVPRPSPMWGRQLSYMNELAGGPRHGYEQLVDSNFDWGQDLPRLGEWMRIHRVAEPMNLVYLGSADPRRYGVPHVNLSFGYWAEPSSDASAIRRPGWLAISASAYEGLTATPGMRDYWRRYLAEARAERVGEAGYSIFVYRLP
jgi:hypothetical protein